MKQPVVIEVYDKDSATESDFIGKAETSMGAIMGSMHQTLAVDLLNQHGKNVGKVVIRAEKIEESSHSLRMKWSGEKIKNVDSHFDFWDKSDPYLKFSKVRDDNTFIEVARTEIIKDNLSPSWSPIIIPASRLFNMKSPVSSFKVECWDDEEGKKDQYIG